MDPRTANDDSQKRRPYEKAIQKIQPRLAIGQDSLLYGEITHVDDFPLMQILSADPKCKGRTQAILTNPSFATFYNSYIKYLPLGARKSSGMYLTDPWEYIKSEIRKRQLDFSYIETELHFYLKELNRYLDQHNKLQQENNLVRKAIAATPLAGLVKTSLFTLDDLKALIAFCDVYKGIGCSAAVRTKKDAQGDIHELIRNLDWNSLDVLGDFTLGMITCMPHEDPNKPQAVFSGGFTPGLLGLSMANDKGLVVVLDEATKMQTKRENPKAGAIPQFLLIRQIVENCATLKEVKLYLRRHQPATSHILTVRDASGAQGVFEMLPSDGPFQDDLFHFRGVENPRDRVYVDENEYVNVQLTSNHFLDADGKPLPQTAGFDCSIDRYNKMEFALGINASAKQVANASSVIDTVQTYIFTQQNNHFYVDINWANGNSAQAIDPNINQVHYSKLNLKKLFKNFLHQAAHFASRVGNDPISPMDAKLITLQNLAVKYQKEFPALSAALSEFYSELSFRSLSDSRGIEQCASVTCRAINEICIPSDVDDKLKSYARFEQRICKLLNIHPLTFLDKVKIKLEGILCGAVMAGLLGFLKSRDVSTTLKCAAIGAFLGYLKAQEIHQSIYATPKITLFSRAVAANLKKVAQIEVEDEMALTLASRQYPKNNP